MPESNHTSFTIEQWCDFVRETLEPQQLEVMRQTLAEGSGRAAERARRTVGMFRRVQAVAHQDRELAVPEFAVRMAKAIATVQHPQEEPRVSSAFRFLPFQVTFDSLIDPLPAGARHLREAPTTHAGSERQLVIESGDFSVDVRLEHGPTADSGVVVGQVLHLTGEASPAAQVPVLLLAQGKIVGRAITGPFGEFHAEGLPRQSLSLCVLVADQACLEISLEEEVEPNRQKEE